VSKTDYRLATWDEQDRNYIEISAAEFEELKSAKANVLETMFIEEKMDLVIENYLEWENELLYASARQMVQLDYSYLSAQSQRNLFSRRIMNVLTACRGYLDQVGHHLSNIYGEESSIAAVFKKATNEQYDRRLGYRVMEALRNYVQHRGSPLHVVVVDRNWVESEHGKRFRSYTGTRFKVSILAEDPKFKKSVLGELQAIGRDEIDLQGFVREYVGGLSIVHQAIRDELKADVTKWEAAICTAIERFRQKFPDVASGTMFALSTDHEVWLSTEYIESRRGFEQKNRLLSNLADRYVTNEIVKK